VKDVETCMEAGEMEVVEVEAVEVETSSNFEAYI
jgi:hypothetical protein